MSDGDAITRRLGRLTLTAERVRSRGHWGTTTEVLFDGEMVGTIDYGGVECWGGEAADWSEGLRGGIATAARQLAAELESR